MTPLPPRTEVLVIGGGPAGSICAASLAAAGRRVVLLERETRPRLRSAEALPPASRELLLRLGAGDPAAAPGCRVAADGGAFIDRAGLDLTLRRHAAARGVELREATEVRSLAFDRARAVAARWRHAPTGDEGRIAFDVVVDASGRDALIADRYANGRRFDGADRRVVICADWTPCDDDVALALDWAPGSGRAWAIPLAARLSIGIAVPCEPWRAARRLAPPERIYRDALTASPIGERLVRAATRTSELRIEHDLAWTSRRVGGAGYLLAGDAAGAVAPWRGCGTALALVSGDLAAAVLIRVLRHQMGEAEAVMTYQRSLHRLRGASIS